MALPNKKRIHVMRPKVHGLAGRIDQLPLFVRRRFKIGGVENVNRNNLFLRPAYDLDLFKSKQRRFH